VVRGAWCEIQIQIWIGFGLDWIQVLNESAKEHITTKVHLWPSLCCTYRAKPDIVKNEGLIADSLLGRFLGPSKEHRGLVWTCFLGTTIAIIVVIEAASSKSPPK
jgi:hypothetical protein